MCRAIQSSIGIKPPITPLYPRSGPNISITWTMLCSWPSFDLPHHLHQTTKKKNISINNVGHFSGKTTFYLNEHKIGCYWKHCVDASLKRARTTAVQFFLTQCLFEQTPQKAYPGQRPTRLLQPPWRGWAWRENNTCIWKKRVPCRVPW